MTEKEQIKKILDVMVSAQFHSPSNYESEKENPFISHVFSMKDDGTIVLAHFKPHVDLSQKEDFISLIKEDGFPLFTIKCSEKGEVSKEEIKRTIENASEEDLEHFNAFAERFEKRLAEIKIEPKQSIYPEQKNNLKQDKKQKRRPKP